VEPVAADSIIKRQYRKLALLLHPDKNKAVGAEAAFKLVSEAFGVLSDKDKRAAHDARRGLKAEVWQAHTHVSSQAKAHATRTSEARAGGPHAATGGMPAPSSLTFWTACPECHMQYQYLRTYLNFQVQCQKCHKHFEAKEMMSNGSQRPKWRQSTLHEFSGKGQAAPFPPSRQQDCNGSVNTRGNWAKGNGFTGGGVEHVRSSAMPSSAAFSSKVAETVSVVQEAYLKVRRNRVEAEKEAKREKEKEKEKEREMKEILRQERWKQKKHKEELKAQEALDRMKVKQQEVANKGAKGKTSERNGNGSHSHKRKRNSNEEEEEEDEDEYQQEDDEYDDQEDSSFSPGGTKSVRIPSGFSLPRRSLRNKRNVAYNVDDSDNEELPQLKRSRLDAEAEEVVRTHGTHTDLGIKERIGKGKCVSNGDEEDEAFKSSGEAFKSNGCESAWQASFQVQSKEKCNANDIVKDESSETAAAREARRKSSVEGLEEKFRRELNASFRVSGVGANAVKESGKWEGGITVTERLAEEFPGQQ